MRGWLLVMLVGCQYHPSSITPAGDGPLPDAADAPDDAIDADGNSFVLCDQPGTDLRLCLDFDGDTTDRSGHGNTVTNTGVTYVTGIHGMAVNSNAGDIVVADNASLDVTQFTIRMKVFPSSVPTTAGARYGLIENNVYRMFILQNGVIRCAINGAAAHEAVTVATIQTNQFTRLACTYDGLVLKVFMDGVEKASSAAIDTLKLVNTTTPIAQSEPLDPTERLQGAMDELELFGSIQPP